MIAPVSPDGASGVEGSRHGLRTPYVQSRRWLFFGLVLGTTLLGTVVLFRIMATDGIDPLEILILFLFAATFSWIAFAFWTAIVGFTLLLLRRDAVTLDGPSAEPAERPQKPLESRTALVMPVHNEDPVRVTSGLAAMVRSLVETGEETHFDVYLLSDTTDPDTAWEEERAWAALRRQLDGRSGLYYRRRERNTGRKAGNIADFCRRWGMHYDFMVVLDADSIMSGPSLVRLVRAMEATPDAGLIQTLPVPARQSTLFGRILQFGRALYGPMVASGLAFWHGEAANYWGHNAIVRVAPFTKHCGLPVLPGRPPLGGEILSHDFVEAALLRRAGWKVYLFPEGEGSFEEVPGNILDYAKRDRRWSQGNLQHLRLLAVPGLHPVNRIHFVVGAMGYLSSSLWLLMLVVSTLHAFFLHLTGESGQTAGSAVVRGSTLPGVGLIVALLVTVVVVLFLPKFLALALALVRHREPFGGAARLVLSALLETVFAIVIAPLMMVYHSQFVMSILTGRSTPWNPQAREGRTISWSEAWRTTRWITLVGMAWALGALLYSPTLLLWLTPVLTGLVLAPALVRWTSRITVGEWARRCGLFLVPTETSPASVLEDAARTLPVAAPAEGSASWGLPPERPRAMVTQVLDRRDG